MNRDPRTSAGPRTMWCRDQAARGPLDMNMAIVMIFRLLNTFCLLAYFMKICRLYEFESDQLAIEKLARSFDSQIPNGDAEIMSFEDV